MANIALIVFCTLAGIIFKKYKLVPFDAHKGINTFILYLALPAVSLKYIPKIAVSKDLIFPILSSVIICAGSYILMYAYCRYKKYSKRSRSSLEISSGYSNTSFIGFPLIMAYYGEKQLETAIICDQSMFIILSTIGIIGAMKSGKTTEKLSTLLIVKRFFTFPPVIGCILALALSQFSWLQYADPFFDKLTATIGPLALFSLGLQLNIKGWKRKAPQISMAVFYKLLIAPLLVLAAALLLGIKGDTAKISIFEASMPTLITASIIAEQFHLNSRLVNLTIGISILLGFATTAVWAVALNFLF